jgi:uncharacterized peroxidase-related enzyme
MDEAGFLRIPTMTPEAQALFDEDLADGGYVWNASKLWAYQPETLNALFALMGQAVADQDLSFRQRGILVTACASTLGDSYCSLAWGSKLSNATHPGVAASVLTGTDEELTEAERALANWARQIVRDPNSTDPGDVQALRDAGFTDSQIFAITTFVALRLAFSTINDSLGAHPDAAMRATVPESVLAAVTYGRAPDPADL